MFYRGTWVYHRGTLVYSGAFGDTSEAQAYQRGIWVYQKGTSVQGHLGEPEGKMDVALGCTRGTRGALGHSRRSLGCTRKHLPEVCSIPLARKSWAYKRGTLEDQGALGLTRGELRPRGARTTGASTRGTLARGTFTRGTLTRGELTRGDLGCTRGDLGHKRGALECTK